MASREPAQRIITAKETTQGRRQRKELCVEIGSFKHPYFSNSVRRQIQETGKECFSPKLSAKILEKQYERRASVRLNYAFNGDEAMDNEFNSGSGILTSQQIRSSMMHGTAAASTSSTPLTIDKTNAQNDKNKNKNNTNTNKHNTNEDLSIVTSNLHAHSNATKMSPGSNKASDSTEDSEETIDWNARARNYNPIFVKPNEKHFSISILDQRLSLCLLVPVVTGCKKFHLLKCVEVEGVCGTNVVPGTTLQSVKCTPGCEHYK
jgi:hypothetical protein